MGWCRHWKASALSVARGEIVGVVGESGSGKSVTAYTVMGLNDEAAEITSGRITMGGIDLLAAKPEALRELRGREMAMIFQSPRTALNPIRKVGKQIEDVLREHANLPRRDLKQAAIAALARVRIPDPERRAEAYPFELSGGMCQRVMIAMALACTPSVLIADEPTTGLDVTTQAVIMDLIRDMSHDDADVDAADHTRSRARRRILRPHRRDACGAYRRDRRDRDASRSSARIPIRASCWPPRRSPSSASTP